MHLLLYSISCGTFLNNYDVSRVKLKRAEIGLVLSYGTKTNNNEGKSTNGDYFIEINIKKIVSNAANLVSASPGVRGPWNRSDHLSKPGLFTVEYRDATLKQRILQK